VAALLALTHSPALSQSSIDAEAAARSLSNPNTPLATLNFENQFRWHKGDLPGADKQNNYTLLFQPALPFPVNDGKGSIVFLRPAVPVEFNRPVFDLTTASFDDASFGIGDIGFDLAYGRTEKSGFLWTVGLFSTLPTATNSDLAGKHWTLGPEAVLGHVGEKLIVFAFPTHQWDVAGWGDNELSLTTLQGGFTYLLAGGWNIGSSPTLSYDWENSNWTVPVQFNIGKTTLINGQPWKFSLLVDYFVEQPDAFGPDFLIRFKISPVVENPFASLIGR
jgi:hypothetical protein